LYTAVKDPAVKEIDLTLICLRLNFNGMNHAEEAKNGSAVWLMPAMRNRQH